MTENSENADLSGSYEEQLNSGAESGNVAQVLEALNKGASVNTRRPDGSTPLMVASTHGHLEVVQTLLAHGAALDDIAFDGDNALALAAQNGHFGVVKVLLTFSRKQDVPISLENARKHALGKGYREMVIMLDTALDFPPMPISWDDTNIDLGLFLRPHFLKEIQAAQQHMVSGPSQDDWRSHLRFITNASSNPTNLDDLRLVQPLTAVEYVAVSYCWESGSDATPREDIRIQKPNGESLVFAAGRADILRHALAFAKAYNIEFVWMDQVCIYQDDPDDKKAAISKMHMIYQQSQYTLVILDPHVRSGDDARSVSEFGDPMSGNMQSKLSETVLFDRWFTRAWTAQEHVNSDRERMYYMIPWHSEFDLSGEIWKSIAEVDDTIKQNITRSWILPEWRIMPVAIGLMLTVPSAMPSFATWGSGSAAENEKITTLLDHVISPSSTLQRLDASAVHASSRLQCAPLHLTMQNAFRSLVRKQCLYQTDKLAILANLTHYPHVLVVDDLEWVTSFSAAILALALYNGDLSPLFCELYHPRHALPTLPSWLPYDDKALYWILDISGTSMHNYQKRKIYSGPKCLVHGNKLLVAGLLWEVVPFSDLSPLQEEVHALMRRPREKKEDLPREELLQLTLRLLFSLKRQDIVELFVTAFISPYESPEQIFDALEALDNWHEGGRWPASSFTKVLAKLHLDYVFFDQIMYAIELGKPLKIGICQLDDQQTLTGIFTFQQDTEQSQVLVPISELEHEFGTHANREMKDSMWMLKPSSRLPDDAAFDYAKTHVDGSLDVSREMWEVDETDLAKGLWSNRLTRNGIFERDPDSKKYRQVPLGSAAKYFWLA